MSPRTPPASNGRQIQYLEVRDMALKFEIVAKEGDVVVARASEDLDKYATPEDGKLKVWYEVAGQLKFDPQKYLKPDGSDNVRPE